MKIEEIIPRIKKNKSLNKAEKKELISFWEKYQIPFNENDKFEAH